MTDLKQAFRQLRKHPFTNAVIVATIALLIGAVSVIYASIRNEQARLTPFPEADQIVKLWRVGEKQTRDQFPPEMFHGFSGNLASFERLGAVREAPAMTLADYGEAVSCNAVGVSPDLLPLTKVSPLMGRLFDDFDFAGQGDVAIISEQLWREKLGGEEAILGARLKFDERAYTVVGVMPESMRTTRLSFETDVWLPSQFRAASVSELRLFGRLKDGVDPTQAQAELDAIAPALEKDIYAGTSKPDYFGARAVALDRQLRNENSDMSLVWMFAGLITTCVVGIACFNIANLLFARVASRAREMAIRLSVGASRSRLVRQLLTETMLLAGLGGFLGLIASFWFHEVLRFQHVDVRMDWQLYLLTALGTAGLGFLVGLVPALRSAQTDLNEALRESGGAGNGRHRVRNFLVATQTAMAVILCVAAGAWTRAYLQQDADRLNFDTTKVVSVRADLGDDADWDKRDWHAYVQRTLEALNETPGVESAVVSTGSRILVPDVGSHLTLDATDLQPERSEQIWHSYVSHGYTDLSGMSLLQGRDLSTDPTKASNEALVNERFAAEYLDGIHPLGQRVRRSHEDDWATIVGVVRDRGSLGPRTARAEAFFGYQRCPHLSVTLFTAKTSADAHVLARPLRRVVRNADATLPLSQPAVVADLVAQQLAGPRKALKSLGLMAGVGLFISLIGVGGVVAFAATQRTREIGIRMALGSTRVNALRLVMWQGLRLVMLGAPPGILISAFVISRLPREGMTLPLAAFDPIALAAVVLVVAVAGSLAALLPARKAANLNPMDALRHE